MYGVRSTRDENTLTPHSHVLLLVVLSSMDMSAFFLSTASMEKIMTVCYDTQIYHIQRQMPWRSILFLVESFWSISISI